MLRLLAHIGADYYLRKLAVMLCVQGCATSRRARSRNRSESCIGLAVRNRRDVAGSMRRLFCLKPVEAYSAHAVSAIVVRRGPSANRRFAQSADPAATPKSERPSGRRRSRTGGRLRVSPLTRCRATLNLCSHQGRSAAKFVPNSPPANSTGHQRTLNVRPVTCPRRARPTGVPEPRHAGTVQPSGRPRRAAHSLNPRAVTAVPRPIARQAGY